MAVFMNILKSNSAEKLKEEDTLDLKGLFCFHFHKKYQKIKAFLPLFPPETQKIILYITSKVRISLNILEPTLPPQ